VSKGYLEIIKLLLAKGADIEQVSQVSTLNQIDIILSGSILVKGGIAAKVVDSVEFLNVGILKCCDTPLHVIIAGVSHRTILIVLSTMLITADWRRCHGV
jgi:hypothetical protein